jgi:hypothetical protein
MCSLRSQVIGFPSPWPSPARGEGTYKSSAGANKQLDSSASQEALDALEKHFPSPLAGEGQGEGKPMTRERSEHLNSKLITKNSKLLKL